MIHRIECSVEQVEEDEIRVGIPINVPRPFPDAALNVMAFAQPFFLTKIFAELGLQPDGKYAFLAWQEEEIG